MPKQKEGEKNKDDLEEEEELEELLWRPDSGLTDEQIDQFIIISRSVGTFARALDCSSSVKQPSLHMSAAAASRDITVFHAYQVPIKSSLGRYVFGSEISYNKPPPRLPGLGC
jgi:metastasis-associated protein MTA